MDVEYLGVMNLKINSNSLWLVNPLKYPVINPIGYFDEIIRTLWNCFFK